MATNESLHGFDDVHSAAQGIFDALPDDPFGDETAETPTGTEEQEEAPPAEDDETPTDSEEEGDLPEDEEEEEESDESEDDESEDEVEEDEEPSSYTVKVDGEQQEVTLEELQASYSRTASWTRKSQALAQERKTFESELQAIAQERSQYGAKLAALDQQLQAQMPAEPTGDDPAAWGKYLRQREELGRVQSERADLDGRMQADYRARRDERVVSENAKLVEVFPDWADPAVAGKAKTGLVSFAVGMGFTEEELENTTDHRMVVLLQYAKAYQDLEGAKKTVKKKTKRAPVLKPGQTSKKSAAARSKAKKTSSKRDVLRQSGRVDDAASVIFDTLDD